MSCCQPVGYKPDQLICGVDFPAVRREIYLLILTGKATTVLTRTMSSAYAIFWLQHNSKSFAHLFLIIPELQLASKLCGFLAAERFKQ